MSCGVVLRHGLDSVLLYLWWTWQLQLQFNPLAWEYLCASDAALDRNKQTNKNKKTNEERANGLSLPASLLWDSSVLLPVDRDLGHQRSLFPSFRVSVELTPLILLVLSSGTGFSGSSPCRQQMWDLSASINMWASSVCGSVCMCMCVYSSLGIQEPHIYQNLQMLKSHNQSSKSANLLYLWIQLTPDCGELYVFIEKNPRVPWWLSRLRIWHCHCCDSGHCCGVGSIPYLGTSACHGHGQKEKIRQNPGVPVMPQR